MLTSLKPLSFTFYIKVSDQLNTIGRILEYMSFKEKEVFLIVLRTSIIVLLLSIFGHLNLYVKLNKYKNKHLKYYTTTSYAELSQVEPQSK